MQRAATAPSTIIVVQPFIDAVKLARPHSR
jgi:hypothetical protein